jgi:ABC-type branched-subunit amino acid transport system substrate-binding protein
VLYELLAGQPPFTGPNVMTILKAVATEEPKPIRKLNPEVPAELANIVMQLLAKNPEERYQNALEVAEDLQALGLAPSRLTPSSGTRRLSSRRLAQRGRAALRRKLLIGGLIGAVAIAAGLYFAVPGLFHHRPSASFQGVTQDEVLLGLTAPFSGQSKELGRDMEVGINTYLRSVNDQGGIAGRKITLVALDDGYEPDRALANMKDLYEKRKIFGVIGNVGTPTAQKTLPYAQEKNLIYFGAFSGANLLRNDPPDRYVFNYRASYAEETAAIVKYLIASRKIKPNEIAVFAQNDSYGDSGFQGAAREIRKQPGAPDQVLKVVYERNKTDVDAAVAEILKHPEIKAVVMVPTYKPAALFIEKVKAKRPDMIFTNVSFVGSNALAEELMNLDSSGKLADGVIVTQVVPHPDSQASAVLKYRENLQKYYPSERPHFTSLEGYLDALILCEGLRRAGDNLTNDTLVGTLESMQNFDIGLGAPISYGPSKHQGSNKVWATQLDKTGKYQILDLEQ